MGGCCAQDKESIKKEKKRDKLKCVRMKKEKMGWDGMDGDDDDDEIICSFGG